LIDTKYFKEYRLKLGFTNQQNTKNFFSAKDIKPNIDFEYINLLNKRLSDIVKQINLIVSKEIKIDNIDIFCKEYIYKVFEKLKKYEILKKLNNQGRRPEQG
jgi:chemotaxis methyl-accepting protein methylase